MTETHHMYAVQQMATKSAILTATTSPDQDMIEQVIGANLVLRNTLYAAALWFCVPHRVRLRCCKGCQKFCFYQNRSRKMVGHTLFCIFHFLKLIWTAIILLKGKYQNWIKFNGEISISKQISRKSGFRPRVKSEFQFWSTNLASDDPKICPFSPYSIGA